MKWRYPKLGDTRVVWRFFLFPRRFGDYTYWLHPTRVFQQYDELWCISKHEYYRAWVTKGLAKDTLVNRLEGKQP